MRLAAPAYLLNVGCRFAWWFLATTSGIFLGLFRENIGVSISFVTDGSGKNQNISRVWFFKKSLTIGSINWSITRRVSNINKVKWERNLEIINMHLINLHTNCNRLTCISMKNTGSEADLGLLQHPTSWMLQQP